MAEKLMKQRRQYLAYLLRLWQEGEAPGGLGDPCLNGITLEWSQSGRRQVFASLEDLFAFLEEEAGSTGQGSRLHAEEGGMRGSKLTALPTGRSVDQHGNRHWSSTQRVVGTMRCLI